MLTLWFRTATVAPTLLLNRNITAGLLNKSPEMLFFGIGYHTRYVPSKDFNGHKNNALFKSSIYGLRSYSEKTPGSVPPSPPPSPPNLPDRAQVERAFFRVVAFFWDYGFWLFAWSRKMIKMHVVEKPIVQLYWKRFHDKMEEAKKDT